MAATMRDVARAAGVSIKTVSRVVNKQGEVSDETRRRVLATIQELGYRPSKVARALVTQRTDTLGLILGDISNPFFSEVARGVLDTAQAEGYDVFLCNSDYDPEQELRALGSLADHNVGGMIVFPCWENREKLRAFAGQARPLVVVNRIFEPQPGISLVLNEIRRGARLAVDHLVGKGHRSIGMLAGRAAPLQIMERMQGFREGLQAHELPFVADWVVADECNTDVERGYRSARRLMAHHPRVTAVFAYNDLMAAGAIQACRELGRRVPDDVAIVGYDDIQFAAMVQPPLTTVHIDKYELGRQAVTRLLEMLNGPGSDLEPIRLDVELVVRQST